MDEFIRIWAEYDPSAEGRIYYSEMCVLSSYSIIHLVLVYVQLCQYQISNDECNQVRHAKEHGSPTWLRLKMSRQAGFQKAHQVGVLDSIAVSVLVVILVEFAKYCQRRSGLSSMYLSMFLGMKSEMNMIGE